ncbi:Nucleoporin NUP188 homolog [Eumeta japonica]|uniref:Nucleoporin NUP188 homolog n=1 Tax=Eumeta variegata TaxID=151549 RepID=A0A4C1W287_EUMVA|nr:Nucleoporin NUP188 homolog [Eumeta japonica]
MTAYQVRVMFLDRLQDKHEDQELKIAILEFVAACVGKQPGLTEAFFNMKHITKTEKDDKSDKTTIQDNNDEGILMYMAEYLGTINADVALLHSPLLGCIMALFHALWKNNMQVLVKELRESSNFWEQLTSPLFNIIQPGLRSYAQIFNVLGIELFVSRGTIDPSLKKMLEMFFDTDKKYLDDWIKFIYSFDGRRDEDEAIDRVPVWLGLLTSWKDFTTIFCKCLPICLNIAHKAKMVKLCLTTLLQELKNLKDGRLVVILAELYVIMLANWKDDCFENRKAIAIEIGGMLSNTAIVYECLHPRAKRAILSIGTVSISSLDYEIKANSTVAQSIIRAVTDINSVELEALFDHMNDVPKSEPIVNGHNVNEDIAPIVLALAMVEQCLELYDAMFTGLDRWFQSTMFINKLLCCLQNCLQNRIHYHTSLAALRCLITYSRGPFSKDLLVSDVGQFLWLQLLPPKFDMSDLKASWKPAEWWKVYAHSMDFISMMVMKHGQFFANSAITFVGVHLEHLVEAILMPGQVVNMDSLNLCAATLNLVLQLMKYESRWRIENLNSLVTIMRSISTCLCQCVILALRARRPDVVAAPAAPSTPALDDSSAVVSLQHTPTLLNRILELLHMASLCLCAWSPPLLTLLADPVPVSGPLLVELHFGAPKISYETATAPELSFGTLLAAVCLLTKTLNHSYHAEDSSGSRSPRARRRACSCATGGGSPGGGRSGRSESLTSLSSGTSAAAGLWPLLNERLVAGALDASITLLASQALVVVRNPHVATRHKQLVRRELSSELTIYHDFVRKRVLCATHMRPHLLRHKLGAWPLAQDEDEVEKLEKARDSSSDADSKLPPPPPPKRAANDSMREYILRKHYLDKCAQTPIKEPPSPVSHSTPTSERKGSKRVSWAETAPDSDEGESPPDAAAPYTPLTDVQLNNDEDYFHFMSLVFLYICQNDL